LLMAVPAAKAEAVLEALIKAGLPESAIVGEAVPRSKRSLYLD
jgi:hydrogenase maturation factor